MNQIILTGRLTRDPELRYTANDKAVVNFTIAVDRGKNANGEKETDFPRCKVYGAQAENLCRYCSKGSLIGVEGKIETGQYTNREGQTIYTTEVFTTRIEYLAQPKPAGPPQPIPQQGYQPEAPAAPQAPYQPQQQTFTPQQMYQPVNAPGR